METLNEIYFIIYNFRMCMLVYKIMQNYMFLIRMFVLIEKFKLCGNKLLLK